MKGQGRAWERDEKGGGILAPRKHMGGRALKSTFDPKKSHVEAAIQDTRQL